MIQSAKNMGKIGIKGREIGKNGNKGKIFDDPSLLILRHRS